VEEELAVAVEVELILIQLAEAVTVELEEMDKLLFIQNK
jgi:hypothetical protein